MLPESGAMPDDEKLVSKRRARQYADCGTEKKNMTEFQGKRTEMSDKVETKERSRESSISTATSYRSQSSLEPSPTVHPADEQQEVDTLVLADQGRDPGDSVPRDAFHPASVTQPLAYSVQQLEEGLPAGAWPVNFGVVVPGVYRCSFPLVEDYGFIEALRLKTVVTLVRKDFPQGYDAFLRKNGIEHHVFDMKGTKKEDIPIHTMKSILRLVLDRRNHPLLVHCNHGKHRTGCVIGVVRKLSGWDVGSIIREYRVYAEPKARDCDIRYISGFDLASIAHLVRGAGLPFFRPPSFLRGAVLALVVLVLWLVSGARIAGDRVDESSKRKSLN